MLFKHLIRITIGNKPVRSKEYQEAHYSGSFSMMVDDAELAAIKRLQREFYIHAQPGSGLLLFEKIEQVSA